MSCTRLRRAIAQHRKPCVGVIGAGVAGLRCAQVLLEHGVDVTILEARNRVGGRLGQGRINDNVVDLGPNWIHGTKNNPILDMMRQTKTQTCSLGESVRAFDHTGGMIDPVKATECTEILWQLIGKAFRFSNEHSESIPADRSLMDFLVEATEAEFTPEEHSKKQIVLDMATVWGGFVGGTTETQSLKYLWLEECLEGENLFCAGTYERVLKLISSPAMEAEVVKFGEEVSQINATANPDIRIIASTKAGDTYEFDEVVVTTPLGWLKRNRHVFSPQLPDELSQAIEAVGYGNLDKVYISFPRSWWNIPSHKQSDSVTTSEGGTTAENLPSHKTGTELHERHADSDNRLSVSANNILDLGGEVTPGIINWLSPRFSEATNPEGWTQDCINLANLPETTAHSALLFYTSGPSSSHIAAILRKHEDSASQDAAIYQFFQPYISCLPGYDATSSDCEPSGILATGWENDELAGYGSYTNFAIGIENAGDHIRALRKGMPDRGIWLAGEHTAPFVALGTVTGAWWSGQRAAMEILEAYGIEVTLEQALLPPEDQDREQVQGT